jgi:hypothetical protein
MSRIAIAIAAIFAAATVSGCKGSGGTPAQPAAPKAEAPKGPAPKAEPPKAEAPKPAPPKTEAPKTEPPKTETPKAEAPKTEPAKPVEVKPAEVKPAEPVAGEVVLEAESFTLKDAEVKDLAGAGGGKAVLFAKEDTGSAVKEVTLKAGKYEAVVYVQAPDEDKDAFYLVINGDENRLFPEEYGKVLPAKAVAFEVKQPGAVKIELKASEEAGMFLDRVVIRPAK